MARWILLVSLALAWVSPAQAWTRAQVRDARVDLQLGSETSLEVALELGVEVFGGWLEQLDVSGLEGLEDAEQAGLTAWVKREDGEELTPEVRLKNGVVGIRMARKDAPRRGLHRLGLKFTLPHAAMSERGGATRLSWTLPGWEAGLEQAEIRFVVPQGARPVQDPSLAQQVSEQALGDGMLLLTFQRVHVPRETPWQVAVDLKAASGAARMGSAAMSRVGADRSQFGAAAAFVLLVSFLARQGNRKRARWGGAHMVPLLPARFPSMLAGLVLWGLGLWVSGFSVLWGALLLLASTLLCLERAVARPRGPTLGHFAPIGASDLAALQRSHLRERLGLVPFFDVTSAVGVASVLAACATLAWFLRAEKSLPFWAFALSCALVPLLSTAGARFPRTLATRVRSLLRAAESLRLSGVALNLVWFEADAQHEEPRLRVLLARPHQGLLRIDVLSDTRPGARSLVLCAVVLADSTAQRALSASWEDSFEVVNQAGKRRAYCKDVVNFEQDLEQLLQVLARHEQDAVLSWAKEQSKAA